MLNKEKDKKGTTHYYFQNVQMQSHIIDSMLTGEVFHQRVPEPPHLEYLFVVDWQISEDERDLSQTHDPLSKTAVEFIHYNTNIIYFRNIARPEVQQRHRP